MGAMWDAVVLGFTALIGLVGDFVTDLTDATNGKLNALLPLFAIGISISLVLLCVRIVRKITWGA